MKINHKENDPSPNNRSPETGKGVDGETQKEISPSNVHLENKSQRTNSNLLYRIVKKRFSQLPHVANKSYLAN